ncbi:hypothetical protein GCM10020001_118010 [Nonomuraea salmonea]
MTATPLGSPDEPEVYITYASPPGSARVRTGAGTPSTGRSPRTITPGTPDRASAVAASASTATARASARTNRMRSAGCAGSIGR